ncbi:hypothetical protein CDD83_2384 [Cordyceps sp. RAO-2017]|nr:hypothetical protein CDD83_2384 [Cordyceps sp. RAO-2017]
MPRPRRTRRAPVAASTKEPEPVGDTDRIRENVGRGRGRPRTRTATRLSLGEEDAIDAANRTRDTALDRLANEDATTASGQVTADDTTSPVEVSRRAVATPALRGDTTGLDLADDVFGDLDDSFADGEIPGGGTSADSSALTLSHFKTRSRQSSFVGRNDPPIRPSSRGPNTPGISSSFNIGHFRRRAREPSILGTSRRPLSEREGTANNSEVESEADSEPEAESTPLSDRRTTRRSARSVGSPSPQQPAQASTRKRKSIGSRDSSQRPDKASRLESDAGPADVDSDSELSVLASPSPPSTGLLPRPVTPVNEDEITAPPASSDSEGGADLWPDIHVLAKRRRRMSVTTPLRADNLSDVSSPPSLTHSPNYTAERATRQRGRPATRRHESPKMTTADLTNLLPKRRYKRVRDSFGLGSDEELDGTDLGEDEDELSYLDARAARKRKPSRARSRATSARPGARVGSRSRADGSVLKPKQTSASLRRSARSAKTYRQRSSDKENESDNDEEGQSGFAPLPDDTFDGLGGSGGDAGSQDSASASADELKQAAEKFMEVDKWELEFEEVAEPPSPQNAR